jgi:hypothetical protein
MDEAPRNTALSRATRQLREEHGEESWKLIELLHSIEAVANDWGDSDGHIIRNVHDPLGRARQGDLPDYNRAEAEPIAAEYLAGPLRSSVIDRYLTRLLVEQEYFAYALTQLSPRHIVYQQPLRRMRPIGAFFLNILANLVLLALIFGLTWAVVSFTFIPENAGWIVVAILLTWFILATTYQLITLPRDWLKNKKDRDTSLKLLSAQNDTYLSLKASGPISVSRVRTMVDRAADAGTVWPQTLFALLDDIAARSATM